TGASSADAGVRATSAMLPVARRIAIPAAGGARRPNDRRWREPLDASLAQQRLVAGLVGGNRSRVARPRLEEERAAIARDERPEHGAVLEHDERTRRAASIADRELAVEDVHEVIARVTVALDDDTGIVAPEHHHPVGRPLEELLVDRDAALAVTLR